MILLLIFGIFCIAFCTTLMILSACYEFGYIPESWKERRNFPLPHQREMECD